MEFDVTIPTKIFGEVHLTIRLRVPTFRKPRLLLERQRSALLRARQKERREREPTALPSGPLL